MNTSTLVTIFAKIIIPLLGAIITYFIVPWLKAKYGNERLDTITNWAFKAVQAAEQIFPIESTSEKYQYASGVIKRQAEKLGIYLTDGEIRTLIESVVNMLPPSHLEEAE